jgi:hypothetical protein
MMRLTKKRAMDITSFSGIKIQKDDIIYTHILELGGVIHSAWGIIIPNSSDFFPNILLNLI